MSSVNGAMLTLATVLAVAGLHAGAPARAATHCAGDCGGDGAVTINELIALVNVALGSSPVDSCAAGDGNGDGQVTIDELVSAVNRALEGCPTAAADPVTVAVSLARALAPLPGLSDLVAGALDSIGRSQECELGGTLNSTCEDTGTGTFVTSTIADHCAIATVDGVVESTGGAEITAPGQCPDQLIPLNVVIDFASDAVLQSPDRVPLLGARLDATVTLVNLTLGDPPCSIKGGTVIIDGPVTYTGAADHAATLTFDHTQLIVEFQGFQGTCDPIAVVATADGAVHVRDTYGDEPFAFDATLDDLAITQHRDRGTIGVAGGADVACAGGRLALRTPQSLPNPLGAACFSGGVLAIGLPAGSAQATFAADGGVTVQRTGSPAAVYPTCLDLPRQACAQQ